LQRVVQAELERVTRLQAGLVQGARLWNQPVFTDNFRLEAEKGAVVGSNLPEVPLTSTTMQAGLRGYKGYLESLSRFNTVGKLRNLSVSPSQVSEARGNHATVDRVEALLRLVGQLQPLTTYLAGAEGNLSSDHSWSVRAAAVRDALLVDVRRFGKGDDPTRAAPVLQQELETLKREYVVVYTEEHRRLTLNAQADDRRERLSRDPRLASVRTLSTVGLLDKAQLSGWQQALTALVTCRTFYEGLLEDEPTCPDCHLHPAQRSRSAPAEQILDDLDRRLDALLSGWRGALRNALDSDSARQSIAAMGHDEAQPIAEFLRQTDDDPVIPSGFTTVATAALQGIQTVTIWEGELMDALANGGLPCTKQEFERRFGEFLRLQLHGSDARTTRLMLTDRELALAAD